MKTQDYDLMRMKGECWNMSQDWSAVMDRYVLFGKDRVRRQGEGVVRGQLECMELCLGVVV